MDDLDQWHPIAHYLRKMILAKTWFKSHNSEFVAIVELFKIWKQYLESYKHKVFVLIDYNNFQQFINIKSLSYCQFYRAQKLFYYYI